MEPRSRLGHEVVVVLCALTPLVAAGCAPPEQGDVDDADRVTLDTARGRPHHPHRPAQNVIIMIGDGMSLPQMTFLNQYRRLAHPDDPPTSFERLLAGRNHGFADTSMVTPDGRPTLVADSAASATQIACGVPSIPQVTGLDQDGYPCETALEYAKTLGMSTGLVTDARITHATPGAFVAKQVSRSAENEIALEYISGAAAGKVDVLLGGGARQFLPPTIRVNQLPECTTLPTALSSAGTRADGRNVIDEARSAGYTFVCNEAQLLAVPETAGTRVLGTFAAAAYPSYPERAAMAGLPALATNVAKAIRILERNRDGFFLMVEAGLIDYGAHEHDGAYLLRAMQEADRILGDLLAYVDHHPDTLLLVLGDHDTGTPGFSYRSAPAVTTTLPSGLVHTATFDFGDAARKYALFEHQTLSLGGMVNPIMSRLYLSGYQTNPAYSMEQGIADLVAVVDANSDFTVTADQARRVLTVAPGTTALPFDGLADSFYQDSPMANRLSRVFAEQSQLLWGTGHHSGLPVIVMAAGPPGLARQVRGYYHTTDVGRLMFEALGRD